jgi:HD-GYP domain-containing protein (c-di-GMP phosphodiesterase class II)
MTPRTSSVKSNITVASTGSGGFVSHGSLLLLGRLFQADLSLSSLLSGLLDEALRFVPCRHVAVYLRDADDDALRCAASLGDPASALEAPSSATNPPLPHLSGVPVTASGERLGFLYARSDVPFTAEQTERLAALAGFAAMAVQNARAREREERAAARRRLLDHISGHLHQTLDLSELIGRIFVEVNQAIDAEAQSIWLVDEPAGMIACRFATGPGAEQVKEVTVPLGEGIVGSTVSRQESLLIADAQQDERHSRRAQQKTGMITHSLMSVPLVRGGKAIGAMQALNKRAMDGVGTAVPFNHDDLELFRSIADIAALCIENARLYADLEQSYDDTLETLAAALDTRDHETEGHSRRVVEYTSRLAGEIGLPEAEIRVIRRGALIHDIGKIGVPDAILNKPGPLSSEEQRIMARHPEAGYAMLRGIAHLTREARIVLTHQERWDGTGYPLGLRGEEIPLEGRLFAIADTFDAITSDRPYRRAQPIAVARQVIADEAGRQFDPWLVEAFLRVPDAEWHGIRARIGAESRGTAAIVVAEVCPDRFPALRRAATS